MSTGYSEVHAAVLYHVAGAAAAKCIWVLVMLAENI